jgi:hypothetical protein
LSTDSKEDYKGCKNTNSVPGCMIHSFTSGCEMCEFGKEIYVNGQD